jgi:hypothetical protein
METLTLKWGTVKGWRDLRESSVQILERYYADSVPMSAMGDRPDAARKETLCELIDQLDGEIWNDWSGELMTKDQAKEYVRSYGA